MRSLKWKLVLIYVALVFAVMIISGTFIIMRITVMETDRLKEQIDEHTGLIFDQVVRDNEPEHFESVLNQITKNRVLSTDIQSSILSSNGETIASNVNVGGHLPEYNNSAVISAITGRAKFDEGRWADAAGVIRDWINYAKPYEHEGETYIIYAQMDIGTIKNKIEGTIYIIAVASVIALVFTIIVGIMFAGTITSPITTLAKKAKEMARGKLNVAVDVKSHDEIGQLTKNFNYMSAELHNTMSAISNEKNKLEALLHNMTDGVLAFNGKGSVIHANMASKNMLGVSVINIDDLKKIFELDEKFESMLEENDTVKATAHIQKKYINAVFAPYTDAAGRPGGIIAVLQDLTEQKHLDDMRKEFVANVSHEIRTPITTIKSYAETMLDGAIDDYEIATEFLQTINSEADRMALLVTDLLQLSSIGSNKIVMNYELADICAIVESNVKNCKILAENKEQTMTLTGLDNAPPVKIDVGRATQAITNILSNAVKYSPEKSSIEVRIFEIRSFVAVSIEDNGIGIPEDDLPRIFERFYRVDKARSRAMGGTGLGLAIAKEIMEAMGGFIDAESTSGEGTTMTLFFPKA